MLNVMRYDKIVYLVLLALVLGFIAWGAFTWLVLMQIFQENWGWASVSLGSIGLAGSFLGGLGSARTVDLLWRRFPTLNRLIAPNLNGEYLVETSSNWPIQRRMLSCIQGREPEQLTEDTNDRLTVTGKLKIRQGLFGVKAVYLPDDQEASRSESHIVAASFESPRSDGCFRLHYVYEARVPNPIDSTDVDMYRGAATLQVSDDSLDPLCGDYWTNRSWRKGINTAGRVLLRRIAHKSNND